MSKRYLLDTHCWLWWNAQPESLSPQAHEIIADGHNEILFSVVSAWEIIIKHALGKLRLPVPPEKYVPSRLSRNQIGTAEIRLEHVLNIAKLPQHHRDPFDRLLISQAQVDKLTFITAERQIKKYKVELLWAAA